MAQKPKFSAEEPFTVGANEGRVKLPERVVRDRISMTKALMRSVGDAAY
jgi:hypothetical protein